MPLFIHYPEWIRPEIIPGLPLRWYGLMYVVAFLITYLLFLHQLKRSPLEASDDDVLTMFMWIMFGALLGARIFATTIYDPTGKYLRAPWLIFWPFDEQMRFTGFQGMSYFGGLVGAVISALLWSRRHKTDLLVWSDMLVHGFPLGYSFGRIGNFINGELYGRVTASPLGMLFPSARRIPVESGQAQEIINRINYPVLPDQLLVNLPRHPSQLYEALGEGLILWLLMWFVIRPRSPFKGFSTACYILGYSLARFVIEFYRELDPGFSTYWGLSTGQIFSLISFVAGGVFLLILYRAHQKRPKVETFSPPEG